MSTGVSSSHSNEEKDDLPPDNTQSQEDYSDNVAVSLIFFTCTNCFVLCVCKGNQLWSSIFVSFYAEDPVYYLIKTVNSKMYNHVWNTLLLTK